MKKALSTLFAVLAASFMQAQVLYINNNDGTYQAIDTREADDITFDEEQQLIHIGMQDGLTSSFATSGITNIAPVNNGGNELTFDIAPKVSFDANDTSSYNEETEAIPDDELHVDYGDFIEGYSTTSTVQVTFSETGVTVKKPAALTTVTYTLDGNHLTINSSAGKVGYILRGKCSNGSLKIYSAKKFRLWLYGIELTNPTGPAINIQSGKTVYCSIGDDTTNSLCDGATYSAPAIGADGLEEDQKGTFFSEGQIIFDGHNKGTGILNVTSLGGHAICSDDYIRVRGGNININSAKDGFRTKEKFIVGRTDAYAPAITINATNNGIDCSEGTLTIDAGKLEITSGSEAVKVVYEETVIDPTVIPDAVINGGFIKITTTGEKSSAIKTTRNYTQKGGIIQATVNGNGSKIINSDGAVSFTGGKITGFANGTISSDTTSAGGIKCNGNLEITGGTIALECNGKGSKGINCNGNTTINAGDVTLVVKGENYTDIADDKKSRAITTVKLTVNGGTLVADANDNTINATAGITINGGTVNAYSATGTALNTEVTQTGGWLLTKDAE